MSNASFASFVKGFGLFGLGAPPPPPDSIPLRILGLHAMPSERSAIVAAFRHAVRAAHPDSAIDDMGGHEDSTVAELVWARDILLAKLPPPVTDKPLSRKMASTRNASPPIVTDKPATDAQASSRNGKVHRSRRIKPRPDRYCERCDGPIAANRGDARYCSNACRQATYRRRKAEA